ncbi:MAG: hypothetical protein KIS92_06650 [Planctomycetota bacterium]|nr:hypothetical protein [Planctomycetota bacterium]
MPNRRPTEESTRQPFPLSDIHEPGAYVSCETGTLVRVPESSLREDPHARVELLGPIGEEQVVRISTNPNAPIGQLRMLAERVNVHPNF